MARASTGALGLPLLVTVAAIVTPGAAAAQCGAAWQGLSSVAGAGGGVRAIVSWDPDGAGPATPVLVLGGTFHVAGSVNAEHIVAFDPATGSWTAFDDGFQDGFDAPVNALAVSPTGELVAGGEFDFAGGVQVNHIARWTAAGWRQFGPGLGFPFTLDHVRAIAFLPGGDLIAGGAFLVAGSQPLASLARWDGATWSAFGDPDAAVSALLTTPSGELIAGGWFTSIGGVAAGGIASWNGANWAPLGSGVGNPIAPAVFALAPCANGDVLAAGQFVTAGGASTGSVARWNGSAWLPLGAGVAGNAYAVTETATGEVVVGGGFGLAGGLAVRGIASWDGSSWSALDVGVGTGSSNVNALCATPLGTFVGGDFTRVGDSAVVGARGVALWTGGAWQGLTTGIGDVVTAFAAAPGGDVFVGGSFLGVPGLAAARIARFDGSAWHTLGAGLDDGVGILRLLPDGRLIAGGAFTTAGGVPANHIACWDGASWTPLGSGCNDQVTAIAVLPDGDLVVGGTFTAAGGNPAAHVARWDGSAWHALGAGTNNAVADLAVLPNGNLVAGGFFTQAGGAPAIGIAQWDGVAWSTLGGSANNWVLCLAVLPNGDLLAGGKFLAIGGVPCYQLARWDGVAWSSLGNGDLGIYSIVSSIVAMPDGSAIIGGMFPRPGPFDPGRNITRWRANTFTPFGTGADSWVVELARTPDDAVLVGGWLTAVDGVVAGGVARLESTCPSSVVPYGSACVAAGGTTSLSSTPAWIGAMFRATANGVPADSFVVAVSGLAPTALPLPALLPQGIAGCGLFVTPDVLQLLVPAGGVAQAEFPIPFAPVLVGASFAHQHLPFVFDLGGNLTGVASSNALAVTVGRL